MMSSIPSARFRFAFWLALAAMVICLALRLGSATLADPIAPPPPQEAPVVAAEKIRADIRYLASRELEGRGIGTPRIKYDDYAGLDVRGKIVVALRQSPEGDDLKSKFAPFAPLRSKAMTAREKGAAGILLVTGPLTDAREDLGVFRYDASFS